VINLSRGLAILQVIVKIRQIIVRSFSMFKTINLIFSMLVLSLTFKISAETLPVIPAGCFDEAVFCTEAEVVNKVIDGREREVINVKVFMVASFSEFESVEDLLALFFDFNSWDEYANKEGSERIKFKGQTASQNLGSVVVNGIETQRHYAHYKIKSPIGYITVRAVGYYWMVEPFEGAEVSAQFENQTSGTFEIPSEGVLEGGEGFKYTAGNFHIRKDEENQEYVMYFNADVIPSITILPSVAKKPILGGFESILKGMFDL